MMFDEEVVDYLYTVAPDWPQVRFEWLHNTGKDKKSAPYYYCLSSWVPFDNNKYKRICLEVFESVINPNDPKVQRIQSDLDGYLNQAAIKVQRQAIYNPQFDILNDQSSMYINNVRGNRWLIELFPSRNCTEVLIDLPIVKID